MDIKKATVNAAGSCNFCDRSKLSRFSDSLVYEYNNVYTIQSSARRGGGLKANICIKCANELSIKVDVDQL